MIAAGVLDTSVFIANESGRVLNESGIPEAVATTVITQDDDFAALDGASGFTAILV